MSKKIRRSTVYKIIGPLCLLATFFILIFFMDCSNAVPKPGKKTSTSSENDNLPGERTDSQGSDNLPGERTDSQGSDNLPGDSDSGAEGDDKKVDDKADFDINDLKNLEYLGKVINATQTLTVGCGFFSPCSKNPKMVDNAQYMTFIPGYTGEYRVRTITNEEKKQEIITNIFADSRSTNGIFHIHHYINSYKQAIDTPAIQATFLTVKQEHDNVTTVRGLIYVDLTGTDEESKQLRIRVGEEKKDGVIIGRNDYIQSGTIIIEYGNQSKKYMITDSFDAADKAKLKALKLFKFTH